MEQLQKITAKEGIDEKETEFNEMIVAEISYWSTEEPLLLQERKISGWFPLALS